ncbi:WD repeat protein [Niveomyces insectorum RCEF 264]|uniref:WD repeat protein n=1 Tax=Niveomyces insectorum RCEF 264 TaxID=1081102 RepID=A0A167X2M7_9HYPO|nr:WD repeat protein [Niveomyces insectorum RCEF 264]
MTGNPVTPVGAPNGGVHTGNTAGSPAVLFGFPQTSPAQPAPPGVAVTGLPLPQIVPMVVTIMPSNNLSPENCNLERFLVDWARKAYANSCVPPPGKRPYGLLDRNAHLCEKEVKAQLGTRITRVVYDDLNGDCCDYQGIDWQQMGVTRQQAREQRRQTYTNYISVKDSDKWEPSRCEYMPRNTDNHFCFRGMHIKRSIHLSHFQLRNLLASASRSRVYYAAREGVVRQFNAVSGADSVALRFRQHNEVQISTIAAGQGVLLAGGFNGEYCVVNTDSEYVDEKPGTARFEGTVTTNRASGISNHIDIHNLRGVAAPLAAFASNDLGLRIVDLETQRILSDVMFPFPVNCTAISPDRRLRVVVGDCKDVFIVAAEPERTTTRRGGVSAPEILNILRGHNDYGFACAWADDGYTLATGCQDRAIKIWDARKLCNTSGHSIPVTTLRTEMAGARSLRFSPVGSGKRVLIAAEEADFLNVFDAQTFRTHQTLDFFGEIGGVTLTNGSQDLWALCTDSWRGGLLHFERCGLAAAAVAFDEAHDPSPRTQRWRGATSFDWPRPPWEPRRDRHRMLRRRLRDVAAAGLTPF